MTKIVDIAKYREEQKKVSCYIEDQDIKDVSHKELLDYYSYLRNIENCKGCEVKISLAAMHEEILFRMEQKSAPNWQDISTAPKDGTEIIGLCDWGILKIRYQSEENITIFNQDIGWVESEITIPKNGKFQNKILKVKGWMPLPQAPEVSGD